MIGRRTFIAGLGSAAAWPVVGRAQQPAVPVIGFLSSQRADASKFLIVRFVQGLKETGFVEGQNVAIEYRWAENQNDRPSARRRSRSPPRSGDRNQQHTCSAGGEGSDHEHTGRH
jgi:hypothetical protein